MKILNSDRHYQLFFISEGFLAIAIAMISLTYSRRRLDFLPYGSKEKITSRELSRVAKIL